MITRSRLLTASAPVLLACAFGSGACVRTQVARTGDRGQTRERRVVLVTIDGVRWQEVFRGPDPRSSRRPRATRAAPPRQRVWSHRLRRPMRVVGL